MMRLWICLFGIVCALGGRAQVNLTAQEAYEDIDYFFAKIDSIHPNMYWHTSPGEIKAFIKEAKEKCKDGTDKRTLGAILRSASHFFDYHTGVVGRWERIQEGNEYCFPWVDIRREGVFFRRTGWQVKTVNGLPVGEIVKETRRTYGADLHEEYINHMQNVLPVFQQCVGNKGIFSPYRIEVVMQGKDSLIETLGISREELDMDTEKNLKKLYDAEQEPYSLELCKNSSIAIIRYRKCVGRDGEEALMTFLDNTFHLLKKKKIRFLFIDVSRNPGGSTVPLYKFFPYLEGTRYAPTHWTEDGEVVRRAEDIPDIKPFRGKVFVYQSPFTNSAAPWLCEKLKNYGAATLVGTDTEPVINIYSQARVFGLPHSHIRCRAAERYYDYAYSNCCYNKSGGLMADIPYPFLIDRLLDETDCLKIISLSKQRH